MYYLVFGLLYIFSLLPLWVLYRFADLAYLIIYYITGYRKEIVMKNLQQAFPEKTEAERKKIARQFYKNFTDTFIESVKLISAGKKFIQKRSTGEFDIINNLIDNGNNITVLAAHQFNWEFANLLYSTKIKAPFVAIYMPIQNKSLNRIFFNMRKRFGTVLISARDFVRIRHTVFSKQYMLAMAADQNPGNPAHAYWINFLGKPAPFTTGPAKGASLNNAVILIARMTKLKRGHYHFSVNYLTENDNAHTPEQLTVLYKNKLEKIIREDPANYLWSHRRWKHDWKPEYGEIIS